MSDKLFHTTQSETLLSGIHFDPIFSKKREQWIKVRSKSLPPSERALKGYKSIYDGIRSNLTVSVDANGSNSVGFSN